jgi:hypothetical protein
MTGPSEKILDRLLKLFSLAENNPSPAEANAALMMAQKLMAEHAIGEDEIRQRSEIHAVKDEMGSTVVVDDGRQRIDTFAMYLAQTIAANFRVKMTVYGASCRFHGYESNRRAAEMILKFARQAMENGAAKWMIAWRALNENPSHSKGEKIAASRTERQSWMMGFIRGLADGFADQLKANPQWLAVVSVPQDVEDYVRETILGGKGRAHAPSYARAYSAGARANGHKAGVSFASANGGSRSMVRGVLGS